MATKKQFEKRCGELNVEIEDNGFCMTITAPIRKLFASYFTHDESIQFNGGRFTKPELYDELLEVMKDGLTDCDEPDCEFCESREEK
jgi:hypothetical protein